MKTWCSEGVRTGPRSEELAGPEELAGRRNWRSRRNWRGRGPGQAGTAIHPLLGNRESSHKARVQEPPRSTGAARRSGTARQLRCERFPERGRRLFTRIAPPGRERRCSHRHRGPSGPRKKHGDGLDRRSPTGIAREREISVDDTAPSQREFRTLSQPRMARLGLAPSTGSTATPHGNPLRITFRRK